MFENLTYIAVLVFALWVVASAVYLYTSRQQGAIEDEIDDLRERLDRLESEDH